MVNGILLVDKEIGPTSHDLVGRVRRIFKQKRVGHCGTLDPAATGLLVILLGQATRLAPWLQQKEKVYEGTIRLGRATDTFDAQGEVTAQAVCRVEQAQVDAATLALTGAYSQIPPVYSAIKVQGRPAYESARQGLTVELKPRDVNIDEFKAKIVESGDYPLVKFRVACSSGTYIRSLAVDFGEELGCPAHIESLRRLRVGRFAVEDGRTTEELMSMDDEALRENIVSLRDAVDFAEVFPDDEDMRALGNGARISATIPGNRFQENFGADEAVVKIVEPASGRLIALGRMEKPEVGQAKAQVKPFLVFASN